MGPRGDPARAGVHCDRESDQRWTSSPGARKRQVAGDHFELFLRPDKGVSASIALQAFTGFPILEVQAEFHNALKTPVAGVTAFGPFRFALRDDLGPLQVHAVRRNEYGLESIPVNGPVAVSGGRWNAPEYGGLLLLEAVGKDEFLLIGIEWERGWRYRIEKEGDGTWLSVDVADLTYDMSPGERLSAPTSISGLVARRPRTGVPHRAALHAAACLPCSSAEHSVDCVRLLGDGSGGSPGSTSS